MYQLRNLEHAGCKEHFGYLSSSRKFEFDVYDVFSALVYARVVAPLSKHQTFHDILPKLYVQKNFSYDQLLEGLEFMGEEYEKLVEILTVATDDNFILDSRRSYFDCTNYYFEIDKESTLQKEVLPKKIEGTLLWEWAFF